MCALEELHAELRRREGDHDRRLLDSSAIDISFLDVPARGHVHAEDWLLGLVNLCDDCAKVAAHRGLERVPKNSVDDKVALAEVGLVDGRVDGDAVDLELLHQRLQEGRLALLGVNDLWLVAKVDQVPCANKAITAVVCKVVKANTHIKIIIIIIK